MKRIAAGRASEIFDLGDGRVLRRFLGGGGDAEGEALVMKHAREHGYPVPRIWEVQPDALVLERIEGPTMLAALRRRPWALGSHAAVLASLHQRLHEIPAPDGVRVASDGDRLIHLDLHPENVMLSPAGPVVIDWTNARRGDGGLDVALTWVIAATSGGLGGRLLVRPFLSHFDRQEVLRWLPVAAERRLADPNVTDRERAAVGRLVERVAGGAG